MSGRRLKAIVLIGPVVAAAAAVAVYAVRAGDDGGKSVASPPSSGGGVLRWVRGGETRIRRSCGFVRARGRAFAVDITEGRFPLTCHAAVAVMDDYLSRPFVRYGSVHHSRLTFECYESRPDRVGWDYNCLYSNHDRARTDDYVAVGAGRRPHR